MPKILIIEACIINFGDDRGGVDNPAPSIVEVPKDTARNLADAGRALYCSKSDDHDKSARNTAGAEMLKAAQAMISARDKQAAAAGKE